MKFLSVAHTQRQNSVTSIPFGLSGGILISFYYVCRLFHCTLGRPLSFTQHAFVDLSSISALWAIMFANSVGHANGLSIFLGIWKQSAHIFRWLNIFHHKLWSIILWVDQTFTCTAKKKKNMATKTNGQLVICGITGADLYLYLCVIPFLSQ